MPSRPPIVPENPPQLPPVPSWLARGPAGDGVETPEQAAFRAGAALAHLHLVATARIEAVPVLLLRDRMALAAAEAEIVRTGGRARAGELRDRMGFLQPGDRMDPATATFDAWRRAVAASLRGDGLLRMSTQEGADAGEREVASDPVGPGVPDPRFPASEIAEAGADPVARAAGVLARARAARPGQEASALMQADAALARSLGWPRLLPLLATGLSRRDLALEGAGLRQACHGAVAREAVRTARLAAELARRADRLRAVAPILRAKASGAAVALFLARDAVAPTMDLSPVIRGTRVPMSPRAAARLCDRLVDLGVVRELTGRATFRLYGL